MKKLLNDLKTFIRNDYSFGTYIAVFLFLGISIAVNYHFDIEDGIIEKEKNYGIRFLLYLLLYSVGYYGTLTIYYFTNKINYFSNKEVMIKSFGALILLAIDGTFLITSDFLQNNFSLNQAESLYLRKLLNEAMPILFYFTGILLIYYVYDSSSSKDLYGLSVKNFHWKPYAIMFMFMIPLIGWASFQEDFTEQYPFLKYWKYDAAFGLSQIKLFCFYEFFYLFNFIDVELLFRGLLIIGMVKCMGTKAVLPMVVTYAFLHFGKPVAETLSSAIGGYILGMIAYYTENIFGGYIIHMGIAFLMDLFAILQIQTRNN